MDNNDSSRIYLIENNSLFIALAAVRHMCIHGEKAMKERDAGETRN